MTLETKIDKIADKVEEIRVTLAAQSEILRAQNQSLELHVKRTNLLEERIEQFKLDMKPVEEHVLLVNKTIKVLVWLIGLALSATVAVLKYTGKN